MNNFQFPRVISQFYRVKAYRVVGADFVRHSRAQIFKNSLDIIENKVCFLFFIFCRIHKHVMSCRYILTTLISHSPRHQPENLHIQKHIVLPHILLKRKTFRRKSECPIVVDRTFFLSSESFLIVVR